MFIFQLRANIRPRKKEVNSNLKYEIVGRALDFSVPRSAKAPVIARLSRDRLRGGE